MLRQGIAVAPMMTEMAIQLGFVCYAINDRANAGGAFAHALSVNPVHPEAIQGLGTVLMDAGDYAQAAELFRRALSANPDDTVARIALGNCLLELGERDAAYACLRAASARGRGILRQVARARCCRPAMGASGCARAAPPNSSRTNEPR